ncbi:serine hydrolase domain-containing protein [Stigmatella hybrida]|uniref:serine hydrolase domain-containing protein n=1 Tax=Stigmatella hybrida TaxID=394097 RepID=UPI001CDAEE5A|nr:serine hydrolase domain-containing protein [Stigmatella hybrida]
MTKGRCRSGWGLWLVLWLSGCATNAAHRRVAGEVDALTARPDFHGVVLVAAGRGQAPYLRAHGMANAEAGVAATAATRYQIGSVSKWLTSIVVLRLVERGTLGLDTPIGQWLPALPEQTRERVLLRHLLSNTSGIPNGVMEAYKKDRSMALRQLSAAEAARTYGSGALQAVPGAAWDYSLTNWVLVRALLEQANGKSFEQTVEEELLGPLKLKDTGLPAGSFADVPGAAMGYTALQPVPQRKLEPVPAYAAASGTFYSTAEDLRRIAEAIDGGGFLSADSVRELSTVTVPEARYALGGRVETVLLGGRNREVTWETGQLGAFKSVVAHVPGGGATVVILNNTNLPQSELGAAAQRLLQAIEPR